MEPSTSCELNGSGSTPKCQSMSVCGSFCCLRRLHHVAVQTTVFFGAHAPPTAVDTSEHSELQRHCSAPRSRPPQWRVKSQHPRTLGRAARQARREIPAICSPTVAQTGTHRHNPRSDQQWQGRVAKKLTNTPTRIITRTHPPTRTATRNCHSLTHYRAICDCNRGPRQSTTCVGCVCARGCVPDQCTESTPPSRA